MKKLILALLLGSSLLGCAWAKEQVDYAKLCQQDVGCLSEAKRDSQLVSTVVSVAYPVAGAPVGAAVLALALWIRGRKKAKEVK